MSIPIHPLAEIFPPLEGEAFEALKADIAANGLSVPITLWRGSIIDGRNRYRAMMELDLIGPEDRAEDVPARLFETIDGLEAHDLPAFVISRNLTRRHLNESQRALVAARLATLSPGRPSTGTAKAIRVDVPGQDRDVRPEALPPASPQPQICGRALMTSKQAAGLMNVSVRSVESARVLFKGPIEVVREVEAGALPVSRAAGLVKQAAEAAEPGEDIAATYARLRDMAAAEKARKVEEKKVMRAAREAALGERLATSNDSLAALGQGRRFGVILADPEWRFETYGEGGKDRSADNHYPCSSLDAIKARPVAGIAAEDCLLLLWATQPMLPQALEVMAAWGFAYRSHLIWAKDRPGTGYWSRNQHELLLIGVKGNIPAPAPGTQPPSLLSWPRGEHSAKPPFAHEFAELCWPNLPKIELNARQARPGWEAWGAEAPDGEACAEAPDGEADGSPSPRPADAGPPSPARGEGAQAPGGEQEGGTKPAARSGLEGDAEEEGEGTGPLAPPSDLHEPHPEYGPDYNAHGVLRIAPAETLAMPPMKGARHVKASIELHPFVLSPSSPPPPNLGSDGAPDAVAAAWMWATNWQTGNAGAGCGISPKWRQFAPTREAALKAAIDQIAQRLGRETGVSSAADRAIMAWLETLAPQAGTDAALPARAAAKGRLARRKASPDAGADGSPSPRPADAGPPSPARGEGAETPGGEQEGGTADTAQQEMRHERQ